MSVQPIGQVMSAEDTFAAISALAAQGENKFLVKVSRRSNGIGQIASLIATFEDVTSEQLSVAETWVSMLFGGGEFHLKVASVKTPLTAIGGAIRFTVAGDEKRTLNKAIFDSPNWSGPRQLQFLTPTMDSGTGIAGAMATGTQGFNGGQGFFVPTSQLPAQQGGPQMQAQPSMPYNPEYERMRAELERQKLELAERTAKVERDMLRREEELKRIDSEMRIRAESDAKFAELKASMQANVSAPKPGELIATIATALTPLIGVFMQTSAASRKETQDMMAAQAARQDAMLQMFMSKMNENKGIDPAITMLFENMKQSSTGAADMMSRMADVMTSSVKNSVAMVEAIADLQLASQDPGNPMLDVVKEGIKMMGTLGSGAAAGAKKLSQQKQPELPQPRLNAPMSGPAPVAVEPANVVNFPAKAPVPSVPAAQVQAGFAGLAQESHVDPALAATLPLPIEPGETLVDAVKRVIMARTEPVEAAARFAVMAVASNDPSVKSALDSHDGVFDDWVQAEIGEWGFSDPANAGYLMVFAPEFERIGVELDLFEPLDEEAQATEE